MSASLETLQTRGDPHDGVGSGASVGVKFLAPTPVRRECADCGRPTISQRHRYCFECRAARDAAGRGSKRRGPAHGFVPESRFCEGCGVEFTAYSGNARFCSSRCQARSAARRRPSGDRRVRYGPAHQWLKRWWTPRVEAGGVACVRCGELIVPGEPWDLGHVDGGGPFDYSGPEHARCNRATVHRRERHSRVW